MKGLNKICSENGLAPVKYEISEPYDIPISNKGVTIGLKVIKVKMGEIPDSLALSQKKDRKDPKTGKWITKKVIYQLLAKIGLGHPDGFVPFEKKLDSPEKAQQIMTLAQDEIKRKLALSKNKSYSYLLQPEFASEWDKLWDPITKEGKTYSVKFRGIWANQVSPSPDCPAEVYQKISIDPRFREEYPICEHCKLNKRGQTSRKTIYIANEFDPKELRNPDGTKRQPTLEETIRGKQTQLGTDCIDKYVALEKFFKRLEKLKEAAMKEQNNKDKPKRKSDAFAGYTKAPKDLELVLANTLKAMDSYYGYSRNWYDRSKGLIGSIGKRFYHTRWDTYQTSRAKWGVPNAKNTEEAKAIRQWWIDKKDAPLPDEEWNIVALALRNLIGSEQLDKYLPDMISKYKEAHPEKEKPRGYGYQTPTPTPTPAPTPAPAPTPTILDNNPVEPIEQQPVGQIEEPETVQQMEPAVEQPNIISIDQIEIGDRFLDKFKYVKSIPYNKGGGYVCKFKRGNKEYTYFMNGNQDFGAKEGIQEGQEIYLKGVRGEEKKRPYWAGGKQHWAMNYYISNLSVVKPGEETAPTDINPQVETPTTEPQAEMPITEPTTQETIKQEAPTEDGEEKSLNQFMEEKYNEMIQNINENYDYSKEDKKVEADLFIREYLRDIKKRNPEFNIEDWKETILVELARSGLEDAEELVRGLAEIPSCQNKKYKEKSDGTITPILNAPEVVANSKVRVIESQNYIKSQKGIKIIESKNYIKKAQIQHDGKFEYYTIQDKSENGWPRFCVYGFRKFPQGSVYAGRMGKFFINDYFSEEEAIKAYPQAKSNISSPIKTNLNNLSR